MYGYARRFVFAIAASLLLLLVMVAAGPAIGQSLNWTQLTPTGGPPTARVSPTGVIDSFDNMIVFGGFAGTVSVPPLFNDVWVLSNADGSGPAAAWKQLNPSGPLPAGRGFHSAIYDPNSNSMIIFGGDLSVGFCSDESNDVWVLANANGTGGTPTWIQLVPAAGPNPGARSGHTAVYDPASNRMIVFGGGTNSGFLNDVWVLANANGLGGMPAWTQLTPTGTLPPVTANPSAVYDSVANTMIVFGGSTNAGLSDKAWVLTHANGLGGTPAWTQLQPVGGPPAARGLHAAVFNSSTQRMTIFGGADSSGQAHNDTWVLSGFNIGFAKFKVSDLGSTCGHGQDKDDLRFRLNGEFTPDAGSAGIDPARQDVTLGVGSLSFFIPAGSFKADHDDDNFHFKGASNGAEVDFHIRREQHEGDRGDAAPEFKFSVEVRGADLSSESDSVTVSLTIANNNGSESLTHDKDCDDDHR